MNIMNIMKLYCKLILVWCFTIFMFVNTQAQTIDKNTDVNSLSDEKIERLSQEIKKRGLTVDQALQMAKMKGASQLQIDLLRKRLNEKKSVDIVADKKVKVKTDSLKYDKKTIDESDLPTEEKSRLFGASFFNNKKLNFNSKLNIPISDSYIIGSGDEISVNIYGSSQQSYQLSVKENGSVLIPDLGPVRVAGSSMKSVKRKLKMKFSSIYNGLNNTTPSTFISIDLAEIRSISINVIGEATMPGTYTLPSNASLFNALYLAGGPNENGSFRAIDLIRNGKKIASVDVYDYLINGKTSSNIQLSEQDVILINPYVNRVKVEGKFKRTGIFETKENESVADIVKFAGGFSEDAYTHRLELYRNNGRTKSFQGVNKNNFTSVFLFTGDSIVSGEIIDKFENIISIKGSVYRPGNYQLTKGLKLSELIKKAEGLNPNAFMKRAIINRKMADRSLESISFSPKEIINGTTDIYMQPDDEVVFSSIFDVREFQTVEIMGEVQFPGVFEFSKGLSLNDLILLSGNFKENAAVDQIEVSRRLDYNEITDINRMLLHTYSFAVDRDLNVSNKGGEFKLNAFDKIYIRSAPGFKKISTVNIKGEVKFTGDYSITRKAENIIDIVKRAGGLTPNAYIKGAYLRRKVSMSDAEYASKMLLAKQDTTFDIKNVKKIYYTTIGLNLEELLSLDSDETNLIVKDGDEIYIPQKMQTIAVSGSVYNPVSLTFRKNVSLRKYINMSGGFTEYAKKSKVYVLYANGTTAATKRSLLFRRFPIIEPGCEVIVPKKPVIDKAAQSAKWLGMASVFTGLVTALAIAFR